MPCRARRCLRRERCTPCRTSTSREGQSLIGTLCATLEREAACAQRLSTPACAPNTVRAAADCGPGSARDSIALSQIESIRYGGSSLSCIGRGTITFVSFHQEFPVLRITLNNALRVYEELQDVRTLPWLSCGPCVRLRSEALLVQVHFIASACRDVAGCDLAYVLRDFHDYTTATWSW